MVEGQVGWLLPVFLPLLEACHSDTHSLQRLLLALELVQGLVFSETLVWEEESVGQDLFELDEYFSLHFLHQIE